MKQKNLPQFYIIAVFSLPGLVMAQQVSAPDGSERPIGQIETPSREMEELSAMVRDKAGEGDTDSRLESRVDPENKTSPPGKEKKVAVNEADEHDKGETSVQLEEFPEGERVSRDKVTQNRVEKLVNTGVIKRQSDLSEALLLMDQQAKKAEGIYTVLSSLGPDVEVEISPGEFRSFEGTPPAIRAEIELIELKTRLAEAKMSLEEAQMGPGDPEEATNAEAPDQQREEGLSPRDDGSDYMLLPSKEGERVGNMQYEVPASNEDDASEKALRIAQQTEARLNDIERMMDTERRINTEPDMEMDEDDPDGGGPQAVEWSVTEIFGAGGKRTAVLNIEDQSREISVGDRIDTGFVVFEIGPNYVMMEIEGVQVRRDL